MNMEVRVLPLEPMPHKLLAIDPGLRNLGVAAFKDGKLLYAKLVKTNKKNPMPLALKDITDALEKECGLDFNEVVIETPKIYPGRRGKANPRDILNLTAVVGAICTLYRKSKITTYEPYKWKGNCPKKITEHRVRKRLAEAELKKIKLAGALSHNIFDAIGIGLYYLKEHVSKFFLNKYNLSLNTRHHIVLLTMSGNPHY